MAHQSHNISYGKHRNRFNFLLNERITGGNRNQYNNLKEDIFLANEFADNLIDFSISIKRGIEKAQPYEEKYYNKKMKEEIDKIKQQFPTFITLPYKDLRDLITHNELESRLMISIVIGDIELLKTFLLYLKSLNYPLSNFSNCYGGLQQIIPSFLKAYLIINTLLSYGNPLRETLIMFGPIINNSTFRKAFKDSSYEYNEWIIHHFITNDIVEGLKDITIDNLKFLLKEMFRLMYFSIALLDDYEKEDLIRDIFITYFEKGLPEDIHEYIR
jgi:hypothetical protein